MAGIILILIFVLLLAFPGFYIITHSIFPRGSKKMAACVSLGLTVLLVLVLAAVMLGAA